MSLNHLEWPKTRTSTNPSWSMSGVSDSMKT